MSNSFSMYPIKPDQVRYIKLGEGGAWEDECVEKGIIRIGFGSGRSELLKLCLAGAWERLADSYIAEGKTRGTARRFANELKAFFQDSGKTLWITFREGLLYWGFAKTSPPKRHADGRGVLREIVGGWKCTDIAGEELTKSKLSGALTKLTGYRGTSCSVDSDTYVVRRINGEKMPEVESALNTVKRLQDEVLTLIRMLIDYDFETLVDLIFSASGWQRQGPVGRTQKTVDLDLLLPTTKQTAFVQVKSRTTSAELADYINRMKDGSYNFMFYIFHTGEAAIEGQDDRVRIIGPDELPAMVIDAGLVSWLIQKVS